MLREFFKHRIKRGLVRRLNNLKIARMAKRVAHQSPAPSGAPILFFKASTGIDDLSWNSGFHLLASWALRLRNIPVVYFDTQRVKPGYYTVNYIMLCREPAKTEEGYIVKRFMETLENIIRRKPEDWLWSHKRWKFKR